jgi:hypothetical protein
VRSDIEGRSSVRLRESPLSRIVFIGPFGERLSCVISTRWRRGLSLFGGRVVRSMPCGAPIRLTEFGGGTMKDTSGR